MPKTSKLIGFHAKPDLLERFESYLSKQEIPPSQASVVEHALRKFLDEKEQQGKAA